MDKVECSICVETISIQKTYKCKNPECNLLACTCCIKKYLLDSSTEPNCMACRFAFSLDDFVKYFPKSWRLKEYKMHTKEIIWSKEQSKMNETIGYIETQSLIKKEEKKMKELREAISECQITIYGLYNTDLIETKKKNLYTYKCPNQECNGLLNKNYSCGICEIEYCKDCFEVLDEENECNEEKKATVLQIKKEAKPCPGCKTLISYSIGCDQIFCTNCGTAFSWKTGEVEKGIIHNPYAGRYFEEHPEAKEAYINRTTQRNNICDIDQHLLYSSLRKIDVNMETTYDIQDCFTNIYNFRDKNQTIPEPNNQDYRIKWLKNEITEDHFKKISHQRYKKYQKECMEHEVLKTTCTIMYDLLREISTCKNKEQVYNIYNNNLNEITTYTNEELIDIGEFFGLKAKRIDTTFNIIK